MNKYSEIQGFLDGKMLFNIQRLQVLQIKLNPSTTKVISDAYAFAWSYKIYPILHTYKLHEGFQDYFDVTKDNSSL